MRPVIAALLTALLPGAACAAAPVPVCPAGDGISVQVLGSGGPIADDGRASTGYVVWVDGRSRVLVDMGGGTFLRFGEAGASFDDLDIVGLSHFHTDHSADFPALLKSGNFSRRERSLTVVGPAGNRRFPGLHGFLDSMLHPERGAYAYLSGYLDGTGGLVQLEPVEVSLDDSGPVSVFESARVRVDAMPVPHGIVPAIGIRVDVDGTRIVFASDQNGSDGSFVDFAEGSALLVMHLAIPETITGGALELHARPSRIGEIASQAGAGQLLLSHFMARSLANLEANVAAVAARYEGPVTLADDLACITLAD